MGQLWFGCMIVGDGTPMSAGWTATPVIRWSVQFVQIYCEVIIILADNLNNQ